MAEIILEGVSKTFADGTEAVKSVDLRIPDGQLLVLVGPSGCGKTTVLRMVAGLEDATDGTILIGDNVMDDVPPGKRDVAMVFQNYALYPHMTVYQNMALSLKIRKLKKTEIRDRVRSAARILDIEDLLQKRPRGLSGGERQRVAMGRAIVRDPVAFLMDEPLSNLDAKLRVQMRSEISRIQKNLGVTTLYVTHDQTEAMTLGDQVAVMRKGVLQQVAPPEELYSHPANVFVAGFIGSPAMNLLPATISKNGAGEVWVDIETKRLRLPLDVMAERPDLPAYEGREIILGIRPEDIEDAEIAGTPGPDSHFPVLVDVREGMGSDVYLHFTLDVSPVVTEETKDLASDIDSTAVEDLEHDAEAQRTEVVARVSPETRARAGRPCELVVDTRRLYFFDRDTGASIYRDGAGAVLTAAAAVSGSDERGNRSDDMGGAGQVPGAEREDG
jgi:multiple sugar transport system ATP-binding protein